MAKDTNNILGLTYQQQGLTAVLVQPGGSVTFIARQVTQPLGPQLGSQAAAAAPPGLTATSRRAGDCPGHRGGYAFRRPCASLDEYEESTP